jgi:EAL domain-containing protein (putative c-di-GMP-specific phosphodiesterase class I)
MATTLPLTHDEFSRALGEARVGLALEPIFDLRRGEPTAFIARVEGTAVFTGVTFETFALREGRSRELALYLYDLAAQELRARRERGDAGVLYFPLASRDIEDQTFADSLRFIAERHMIVPESTALIAPLKDYFATSASALPALLRMRLAGFELAIAIDQHTAPRFRPLTELPITALCVSGAETWRRLRSIAPGKLEALGAWMGWAEAEGLKRVALDVADADAQETARLYGFPFAAGPHCSATLRGSRVAIDPATLKQASS